LVILPQSVSEKLQEVKKSINKTNSFPRTVKSRIQGSSGQEQTQQNEQLQEEEQQVQKATNLVKDRVVMAPAFVFKKDSPVFELSQYYASNRISSGLSLVKGYDDVLFKGISATENWLRPKRKKTKLNDPLQLRAEYLLIKKEKVEGEIKTEIIIISPYDYDLYKTSKKELPNGSFIGYAKPDLEGNFETLMSSREDGLSEDEKIKLKRAYRQCAMINFDIEYIKKEIVRRDDPYKLNELDLMFLRERIKHFSSESYDYEEVLEFIDSMRLNMQTTKLYPRMVV
jgi:hypothetical protein